MVEIIKYLTSKPVFYIATASGNEPQLRLLSFVMFYNDKLYFCTNNISDLYNELKENPIVQVSSNLPHEDWVRISGTVQFDDSVEAREKAFETDPELMKMYKSHFNPLFELFYIESGEAVFYKFYEKPIRKIQL